jgi:hypothetical protein
VEPFEVKVGFYQRIVIHEEDEETVFPVRGTV